MFFDANSSRCVSTFIAGDVDFKAAETRFARDQENDGVALRLAVTRGVSSSDLEILAKRAPSVAIGYIGLGATAAF